MVFPPPESQAGYLMQIILKSQHDRGTARQNSQRVLDPGKGRSQLWARCLAVGCDKSGFDHLSKCCQSPPGPRGGKIAAGALISTRDLSAAASKTNRHQSPGENRSYLHEVTLPPPSGAGQRSRRSSPGLGGLCAFEIFPLPLRQKHPEVSGGLLHHRAITINSNYTSSLAAELCKNNKEVRKKETSEKAEERLLQSR